MNDMINGPTGQVLFGGRKRIYGKGGGGGTVQTSSTTTPSIPDELKPLARLYVNQATDYANKPFQAYSGQRFAGLNQSQNQALDMVANRALNGSQTMDNAEGSLNQFIQGGQTNPYLDQMVNKAQGSVMSNAATAMRGSGSFGNSGIQEQALGKMGDIATQMYGGAYAQDQSNRLNAIQMAPTYGNAAYQDASQLLNAGNIRQQDSQNPLDFQYSQFQGAQDQPLKQMSATSGALSQNMGSSTSGQTPKGGK